MEKKENLKVTYLPGIFNTKPIVPRHYTFICGEGKELYELFIGLTYNYERIGFLEEEILGKWTFQNKIYRLDIYYVVNENTLEKNQQNKLFEAVNAIQKADKELFNNWPNLIFSDILVYYFDKKSNLLRKESIKFRKENI
jgi:hypothetical protein